MASLVRGMVSKNKKRYKEDGFDLDLACILFCIVSNSINISEALPKL